MPVAASGWVSRAPRYHHRLPGVLCHTKKEQCQHAEQTRLFDRESSRSYSKNQVTSTTTISRGRSIQLCRVPA